MTVKNEIDQYTTDEEQIRGKFIVKSSDAVIQSAYLDFSTFILLERTLPNLNDGCKPIAKRLVLAMKNRQMLVGKQLKKSVNAIAECLSSYHPHGDLATYEALVFMTQQWKRPYPLAGLSGNNGNISGDGYAAARYTETFVSRFAVDTCLNELSEAVIPHSPNYNGTIQVPNYLPVAIPNLIINGNDSIAIGMINAVPSHNMGEVVNATIHLIQNPDCSDDDVMSLITGPDFPSGCSVLNAHEAQDIYKRGYGTFIMECSYSVNKNTINISEIPYQSNVAGIISEIAKLTRENKLPINRIINKTGKNTSADGTKVDVDITVASTADATQIMQLFLSSDTGLRRSIKYDFTVFDDNRIYYRIPMIDYLRNFVKTRKTIKARYYQELARKAMTELDLQKALFKVLPNIDRVIEIVRESKDDPTAVQTLIVEFDIHFKQAVKIIDMQIKRLTAYGITAVHDRINALESEIKEYVKILQDSKSIENIILSELKSIVKKYGKPRKTQLLTTTNSLSSKKSVRGIGNTVSVMKGAEVSDCIITLTSKFIRRINANDYIVRKRNTNGRNLKFAKDDNPLAIISAKTDDILWCLTSNGRIMEYPAGSIKEVTPEVLGSPIDIYFKLNENEHIVDIKVLPMFNGELQADYIITATKRGMIKKVPLSEYKSIGPAGMKAMGVKDGDEVLTFSFASSDEYLLTVSKYNRCCVFDMEEVSTSLRPAYGIMHQKLGSSREGNFDEIVGISIVNDQTQGILTIDSRGYGKITNLEHYILRKRGNLGYYTIDNISDAVSNTIAMCQAINDIENQSIFVVTQEGKSARLETANIQTFSRITKGVKILKVQETDNIISGILMQ